MATHVVEFRWSTSRARDTYGYNICSCWVDGVKVSSCNGGGYDMEGTAFGDMLVRRYPGRLDAIKGDAHAAYRKRADGSYSPVIMSEQGAKLYGFTVTYSEDMQTCKPHLDGACGMSSIQAVAKKIGLSLSYVSRRANCTTYMMDDNWNN